MDPIQIIPSINQVGLEETLRTMVGDWAEKHPEAVTKVAGLMLAASALYTLWFGQQNYQLPNPGYNELTIDEKTRRPVRRFRMDPNGISEFTTYNPDGGVKSTCYIWRKADGTLKHSSERPATVIQFRPAQEEYAGKTE